jgi:hypothetical protein
MIYSYEPSFMSKNTVSSVARRLALISDPDIRITLNQHDNSPHHIYTTGSAIDGHVAIIAPHNARFDAVEITFEGAVNVSVEHMSPVAQHTALTKRKTFLKLTMPIPESCYPVPRIAEGGHKYIFPFNFVIPSQLLLSACAHPVSSPEVQDAHLLLPPTVGDAELAGKDDLSPFMSKIEYAIIAKVIRIKEADGKSVTLTHALRKLRVIPQTAAKPPSHADTLDVEYALIRTKSLKKGLFKGKLGKITASAEQPSSFITSTSSASTNPPTLMVPLKLIFVPSEAATKLPRLNSVTTRIKASTFYGVRPLAELAKKSDKLATAYDPSRSVFTATIPLATLAIESSESWEFHPASSPAVVRRDSGYSTSSGASDSPSCVEHEASPNYTVTDIGGEFGHYTATIHVPVTLPSAKTWLPTFQSCLLSRIYGLDFTLSVSTSHSSSTLNLRLPVQIATRGDDEPQMGRRLSEEEAEIEMEVEDVFRPRLLSVPNEDYVGGSVLAGQGQEDHQGQAAAQHQQQQEEVEDDVLPGYESVGMRPSQRIW